MVRRVTVALGALMVLAGCAPEAEPPTTITPTTVTTTTTTPAPPLTEGCYDSSVEGQGDIVVDIFGERFGGLFLPTTDGSCGQASTFNFRWLIEADSREAAIAICDEWEPGWQVVAGMRRMQELGFNMPSNVWGCPNPLLNN